jgi:Flp pilus assembly protein TadD
MDAQHSAASVYGRAGRAALLATTGGVLVAALGLGVFLYLRPRTPPPAEPPRDPRLDYAGPFRNVDPAVRYVSDGRCADCHIRQARAFADHPMGRSLVPIAQAAALPRDAAHGNPFDALGSRFLVAGGGGEVRHRRTRLDPDGRPAAEQEWDVHYAIGSGARGYSYLTERDGYLSQTPVSWYSQQQHWDLSPGFGPAWLTGRAVLPECLFCHANRANHVEDSVNRYASPVFEGHAIGCQRCHGPGELHVEARAGGEAVEGPDATIVNPRHLGASLRDAVCEQCHLVGEARVLCRGRGLYDFRPGLPLEPFWSVFVRTPGAGDRERAVGHVEQMYASRCFQGGEGAGRLGCVSCHDPHERVPPGRRVAHYRDRCLRCHEEPACREKPAERAKKGDSCIDCHMPRYGASDIPHTASTDHRIVRPGKPPAREDGRTGDGLPVASFYPERAGGDAAESERALALALVRLAGRAEGPPPRPFRQALPALEAAVARDPDDLAAGEAKGQALARQNRAAEARAAFEAVLSRAPDRELALVGAGSMAEASGDADAAAGYWQRAVAANPWRPDYRRSLALLLVRKEEWEEARAECEAWVGLDPTSAEARVARVQCLLAAGDREAAREEFARVEALAPDNLVELRARYGRKLR